ncbi:MAG TPA: MarR family winged helix-turn-helix transcriptional regulator [Gemmatimonadaceae bacterium]
MTQDLARRANRSLEKESAAEYSPSTVTMDGLRRIVRALRQAEAKARVAGVPSAQLFVLRQLMNGRDLSIGELSRATLTSQSSVSEVVSRLKAKGLVIRSKASHDNRRAEISLTDAGGAMLKEAPHPFQERLVTALHRLAREDQEALAKGMTAWLRETGISDTPPTMFFEPDGRSVGS